MFYEVLPNKLESVKEYGLWHDNKCAGKITFELFAPSLILFYFIEEINQLVQNKLLLMFRLNF